MSGAVRPLQRPGRPDLETDYLVDPSDPRIQGFDTSGLKEQLMRDIASQGSNAQAQAMASNVQMMGGTGSRTADFGRQAMDIASQTQQQKNRALTELALQEWKDRQGMMGAYNQAKEARNKLRLGQFSDEVGSYNAEQEARAQNTAALLALLGSAAGGLGGAAASSAARPRTAPSYGSTSI